MFHIKKHVSIHKTIYVDCVLGTYAFFYCDSLESVKINGTETIGKSAFYHCTNLKKVYLKDIDTIGTLAFGDCQSLQTVYLENIKTVGDYSFGYSSNGDSTSNNKMLDSVVLSNITTIGRYAFGLNGVYGGNSQLLTRTKVSNNNYTYSIKNGALVDSTYMYIGNSSNPYLMYIGINPFTSSNLDKEVINIKSGCKFIDANSIHRLPSTMPNENEPNYPTVHLTVNVPASVIQILAGAIRVRNCYLYVKIDQNSQMTDIDSLAFDLEDYSDITIILPVTIKRIRGDYYNIDRWTQVYYYGTREQWEAVEVVRYNQQYRDPYMYYYSATKPTWPEDYNGWYGFWYWGTYNGNPCIEHWQRD